MLGQAPPAVCGARPRFRVGRIPTPETDTLAGVGLEVPTGVPESAFLQGGLATLRDPIDVAVSGVAATESWTTRAGLLIRF